MKTDTVGPHEHGCECESCEDSKNRACASYVREMKRQSALERVLEREMKADAATDIDSAEEERERIACEITREVKTWLPALLAGGLSAARTSPIGPTAERLAETILIALENTIRRRPDIFDESEEIPY